MKNLKNKLFFDNAGFQCYKVNIIIIYNNKFTNRKIVIFSYLWYKSGYIL